MLWFKKPPIVDESEELNARKVANKNAVDAAVGATTKLNRVFENDGFTVKIAAAMGAKQKIREVRRGN